jgi:phosphatidylethanolamine/phosphatidyl-N-methylethanolamine N-methyltransferase
MMKINTNVINRIRYTAYAPAYDWAAQVLDASRKKAIGKLEVKTGEKVLMVGAGTGLDLDHLPVGCHITATDITPSMVRRTRKRNIKLGHHLTAEVRDGHHTGYPDNCFDVVILHLILAVIPNPVQALCEAERVLKPGGRISVYDKFVPRNQKPSFVRRFFNLFTNLLFSNITRSFELLVSHTSLEVVSDENADLGGAFRIILLKKSEQNERIES